jgi:hypothetical protein
MDSACGLLHFSQGLADQVPETVRAGLRPPPFISGKPPVSRFAGSAFSLSCDLPGGCRFGLNQILSIPANWSGMAATNAV